MTLPAHLHVDPFEDDDDAVAAYLEDLSVPALIASVVQLTGDPSYLRGALRPREIVFNELQGKLREDEKAQLRSQALAAIVPWRDAGCPPAPAPDPAVVREIMDWIACEPVSDDYAELYAEELDLAGENPRAIALDVPPEDLSVLVIGCGESGLLAGIRLKEAGIPFEILDKNTDVGGTWLENTYPGCRVDVASHFYSYSIGPQDAFGDYYARQPELYAYFRGLFDEHDLERHLLWGCEVETAVWEEPAAQWRVTFRRADGTTGTRTARAVISGVGLLNRPVIPDLPGLDAFPGEVLSSAGWEEGTDLRGKRVALIGAGASGFQLGPAVADEVEQLVVFQRTPQWMSPNPRYHQPVKAGERWAIRHLPSYSRWYRYLLMRQSSDKMLELVRIDPDWQGMPVTANAVSAQRREVLAGWIEQNVGDDSELLAKVMPTYPPMAKRMLQDDGTWMRCLKQPHVELVTDRIVGIEDGAVRTADASYEVDAIILATGFRASELLWPMEIVGRDGVSLADTWRGKPSAYRGISIPGFPNFFILGGPGTGLAHAGSVIMMTECQLRYVGDALRMLLEGGHRSIEPTPSAYDQYWEALQSEVETLMWGHPSIEHSWYKAADGKVYVLCPWKLVDYWAMTARAEPDDHVLN